MNPLTSIAWLAPIVMAWGTIKNTFSRLSSYLFVHGTLSGTVAGHMHVMLWKEWKVIPLGGRKHTTDWSPLKHLNGDEGPTVVASYSGAVLFRKGWKVVLWHAEDDYGKLTCVRGNVSYNDLIMEVTRRLYEWSDKLNKEFYGGIPRGDGFCIMRHYGSMQSISGGDESRGRAHAHKRKDNSINPFTINDL